MTLLKDNQKKALSRWYSQNRILSEVRRLRDAGLFDELEEFIQKDALFPVGRREGLPPFMADEKGNSLFPKGLNPAADLEAWQDAVEVGWAVVEEKLGLSHDEVHIRIRDMQNADWENFVKRADERKKK